MNENAAPIVLYPELDEVLPVGDVAESIQPQQEAPLIKEDNETCVKNIMVGKGQTTGKAYVRPLPCGHEWCPRCGRFGSSVHHRRMAPWMMKILSQRVSGELVFTIPMHIRHFFHKPDQLDELEQYVKWLVRRELRGYEVGKRGKLIKKMKPIMGYTRWHFAGDCGHCKGKGVLIEKHSRGAYTTEERAKYECPHCRGTGVNGNVWHPHLNYIHDVGYVKPYKLERIKKLYKRWLERKTGTELKAIDVRAARYRAGWERGDLTYRFRFHVEYVLRSTFSAQLVETYKREFGLDPTIVFHRWKNTKELGKYDEGWFKRRMHIHPWIWDWMSSNNFYMSLWMQGTDQAVWKAQNGEVIKPDMIVPPLPWIIFRREETIEISDVEYEHICTHVVNQILLQ